MKLLQICDTLAVANGGPARNAFELNRALNAVDDVDVDLVWVRGGQHQSVLEGSHLPAATAAHPGPRKIVKTGGQLGERTIGLRAVAQAMRASDAVIVHGFYLPWIPLVLSAAAAFGKPVFVMPHGALTAYETTRGAVKKALFRRVIGGVFPRQIRAFAVGSDDEATDVSGLFPRTPTTTCGVGTAVLNTPMAPGAHDPIRLLTLCRLAKKKRIDVSIRALAELLRAGVAAQLTVAGAGPERATLERLAQEVGVARHVQFVGQVSGEAKRTLYTDSDLFILASEDENFGIVVAEALAHGLPTVASRHVQAAAIASASPAVRLIDSPDPVLVAAAVTELGAADHSELRRAAVHAARSHFSWDSVSRRWVHMIRNHLGSTLA